MDFYGETIGPQKFVRYIAMSTIEGCPLSGVSLYTVHMGCVWGMARIFSHVQSTRPPLSIHFPTPMFQKKIPALQVVLYTIILSSM